MVSCKAFNSIAEQRVKRFTFFTKRPDTDGPFCLAYNRILSTYSIRYAPLVLAAQTLLHTGQHAYDHSDSSLPN